MRNMPAKTTSRRPALRMLIGAAALAVGATALVVPTRDAAACKVAMPIMDYGNTIAFLARVDAVFVGVAVKVKNVHSGRTSSPGREGTSTATIKVERSWKGKPGKRVTVVSYNNRCTSHLFWTGERNLVFVKKDGRAYHLAWPWAFRGGKAPAEVMQALADFKAGKIRKATQWYPAGAPAHQGLTVARFRMLARSRRPEDRARLRRHITKIIDWAVARNLKTVREQPNEAFCLLRNSYRSDAAINRLIDRYLIAADAAGKGRYGLGRPYSPIARLIYQESRSMHPRYRSVRQASGIDIKVDQCPEAKGVAGER